MSRPRVPASCALQSVRGQRWFVRVRCESSFPTHISFHTASRAAQQRENLENKLCCEQQAAGAGPVRLARAHSSQEHKLNSRPSGAASASG